ncbi:hypothetical protein [Candidatus Symbiopectobacterium sp. 'North America']|uniref:hypothetical protein n=1 Tax=Candidatus Symbiopectobacterium sp. 'North America' TaxID=2794574 RepID=UPI0018CA5BA9|nr:hypothetical protein [Candidatus Symbiopectobacterium sp. 'North America']
MTSISPLVCRDATHYNSHQLAAILTECFTDYVVPFTLDGPTFATRFNAEGLSLTESRIWSANNNPVALESGGAGNHGATRLALPLGRLCHSSALAPWRFGNRDVRATAA